MTALYKGVPVAELRGERRLEACEYLGTGPDATDEQLERAIAARLDEAHVKVLRWRDPVWSNAEVYRRLGL